MKQIFVAVTALTIAFPAFAEAPKQGSEQDQPSEGKSLMEEGMELFWEGLRKEMSPAMEDLQDLARQFGPTMQDFMSEMGPALGKLAEEVKDWSAYHPPEFLPNGDIIIRKKTELEPPEEAPDAAPDSEDQPDDAPTTDMGTDI
ncbi:hypothetical protein [Primorskyibacter sp. S87]|uniref:hypothetical protein n=1 Tax=Primorskyibacter sp. S87 TaxID=3415126 RepID=UPI003C7BC112